MSEAKFTEAAPELYEALIEVMQWIKNWDVPFLDDDEWPENRS